MDRRAKFIVIEGSDGAGKTEQTKRLVDFLKNNKMKVAVFDFPRYEEFYGKLIGARLAGRFNSDIPPEYSSLPYAMDRLMVKPLLLDNFESCDFVVANRYIASNMAHMSAMVQGRKRQQIIDWIEEMEYKVNGMPREDITIFLHMSQKIAKKLVARKGQRKYLGKRKRDIHEANDRFMEESINQYLKIAKQNKYWAVIKCFNGGQPRTISEIHDDVIDLLKKKGIIS